MNMVFWDFYHIIFIFGILPDVPDTFSAKSKLHWRISLQAIEYLSASVPNFIKGDNNLKQSIVKNQNFSTNLK